MDAADEPAAKRARVVGDPAQGPADAPVTEAAPDAGAPAPGGAADPAAAPDGGADAGRAAGGGKVVDKRLERQAYLAKQEADAELRFLVIQNDQQEQHSTWLIDLKNIYGKQLPNMPKEYIVRLVFDRNHKSLVALKENTVIGGITYRVFARQQLSEVAFCAVSGSEQVKGYGTRLMDKLKAYNKDVENVTHLITFADNNAVGYFQKQGFSKEILLEREKWAGYIKEYDGGTLMECIISGAALPDDFPRVIKQQREAVEAKIRFMTNSHVLHPGLACFKDPAARPGRLRTPLAPEAIPGVKEAGWSAAPMRFRLVHPECGDGTPSRENMHKFMRATLRSVSDHADAWPFLDPVDPQEVPDYYEIIKEPMDLHTIGQRIDAGDYYITLEIFAADFQRMFANCRVYNAPDTPYFKCANRLEAFFDSKIAQGIGWHRRVGGGTTTAVV